MKLGEDFVPFTIPITHDVSISGSQAGSGPPLLLLHGFPQTNLIWHKIAPRLTADYRVVALDLRGYGASSKPADDGSHHTYSKSTMARDVATVMDRLNYKKYFICGHDRGARVAHKLCVDFPDRVLKVMFLDIVPTLAMYEGADQEFATAYWHWFFLIQPSPFPEKVLLNNLDSFSERFFGPRPKTNNPETDIHYADALKEYVDQMRDMQCVHGMCEDYRSGATVDLDEQRDDIKNGRKIQCPIKVLWGKKGVIEKKFDAIEEWKKVSDSTLEGDSVDSGHYIAEEVPHVLLEHVRSYFK